MKSINTEDNFANKEDKFNWEEYKKLIHNNYNGSYDCLVLNEKNRLITKAFIKNLLFEYLDINYNPNDITIFEISMTHTSYIKKDYDDIKNFKTIFTDIDILNGQTIEPVKSLKEVIQIKDISYERLEFVGDSILRLIISDYLFSRYPELLPGDLSELRSQIENRKSFSEICKKISLHKYALLSKCYDISFKRDKSEKLQCDLFEAFIAALYYDISNISYKDVGNISDLIKNDKSNSYKICYDLVIKLIEKELDLTILLEYDRNYKKIIVKHYHTLKWSSPIYKTIEIIQDDNNKKKYKCGVLDNEKNIIGVGVSSSKLKAEKLSAKNALYFLKVLKNDDNLIEEITDKNIIYN